jgi:hypothetical protein
MNKITATALFVAGLASTGWAQSNTFPANGNAGVGTTAPIAPFHVIDNNGNGVLLERTVATPRRYNQYIGSDGSWNLYDQTAAAQRIVLGANGNVGIGAPFVPPTRFQVADAGGTYQIGTNGVYWSGFKTTAPAGIWGFQQAERAFFGLGGNVYNRGFSANAIAIFNGSTTAEDIVLYNRNDPGAGLLVLKDSGNVGIGTSSPSQKLTVKGSISIESASLANAGVGSSDLALPYGSAVRFANDVNNATMPMVTLGNYDGKANTLRIGTDAWPSQITFRTGDLYSSNVGGQRMIIDNQGNVGIGTTNPTQKLSVNGTVRAKEVIVDTGWSDFVFDESYKLTTLSETEAFVKAEKHLPGVPSAKEVAEHGISVGEMQAKLLAKIEELTLHQIEQDKRLNAAYQRIEHLERENSALLRN